jgi:hypothetical protein
MYGCDLPTVMRSVRDSYWSRDYRKGTGTRVFLTGNGLLQAGLHGVEKQTKSVELCQTKFLGPFDIDFLEKWILKNILCKIGFSTKKMFVKCTPSVSKYLSPLTFFYNFDHSSYSKNCASTIYFVYYILYCCMYFKLDLSFYMFVIIFWVRWMIKVARKSQWRQIFRYEWSIIILCISNTKTTRKSMRIYVFDATGLLYKLEKCL